MKLWKIMAMLCVCASSFAQVQLGRNVQIGGSGSGGPCPVGPNGSVQYNSSGACAGSAQFITDSQGNVEIEGGTNGSGTFELNSAFGAGGWLMNESHLTLNSSGGNGATGGIDLLVNDSHYTGSSTGLVPLYINCDVTRANKNCIGIEVQSSAEANGTHMTGFESDTPSFGAFTAATSWRYLALTAGQGRAAEEIGYLVTSTISPTDSGYCDFWARNNDGSGTRVKLGCGSTSANTFTGPTTVGDLTITGTCTGCGSGTLTGSGTIGYLPLWTPTTTALGNSNIDDGVTTASTLTTHEALTVADGTGKAGFVGLKQGTAQSTAANAIGFTAPTSVTAYNMTLPGAQWAGCLSNDGSGNLSGTGCTSSGTPQYVAPQAIAGCGVEYVSGLTYTVGACTYSINGVTYSSPLSNITLPAADATNPKIDVIYVDTTGVVQVIQGTPAVTPQQPVVDPSTQLQLTFVLVPATATTPANTTTVLIYDENVEWTSAKGGTSSANVNLASTNNPYHGTIDTEFGSGGAVASTTFAQYTKPAAGTVTLGNYNTLTFYLRNKAAWAKTRSITVQWFNGATALGTPVVLSNGAFGLDATGNITSYQQISIPTSTFGIAGTPATTVKFTVTGSGANLTGFYLDQVTLQGGNGGVVLPTTLMNYRGSWNTTAAYSPNDTVVSGGIGYVALAANTNVAVTTTATWTPLATAGACATCVTSAASLTNNAVMIGGGSQASSTISADTTTTHALFATAGAPAFRALAAGDIPASLSSTTSVNSTTIPSSATLSQTIASGTSALGTSAIASGACATAVTTTATGTATTDVVWWGFNGDPTAVTGYIPATSGMLTIISYPSANNVNFKVCNNTSASVTPGAITLNWRIVR